MSLLLEAREPKAEDGIAGWLLFPAAGLVFSLMSEVWQTWLLATEFIGKPQFETLFPLMIVVPWILFCVVVMAFFFQKHRWAPYLYIAFMLGGLMFAGLSLLVHTFAPDPETADAPKDMVRAIVSSCIWIPYFIKSKRVKLTFVRSW